MCEAVDEKPTTEIDYTKCYKQKNLLQTEVLVMKTTLRAPRKVIYYIYT